MGWVVNCDVLPCAVIVLFPPLPSLLPSMDRQSRMTQSHRAAHSGHARTCLHVRPPCPPSSCFIPSSAFILLHPAPASHRDSSAVTTMHSPSLYLACRSTRTPYSKPFSRILLKRRHLRPHPEARLFSSTAVWRHDSTVRSPLGGAMGRELGFFGRNEVHHSTSTPEQGTSPSLAFTPAHPSHAQAAVGKAKPRNGQTNVLPSSTSKRMNSSANNNYP